MQADSGADDEDGIDDCSSETERDRAGKYTCVAEDEDMLSDAERGEGSHQDESEREMGEEGKGEECGGKCCAVEFRACLLCRVVSIDSSGEEPRQEKSDAEMGEEGRGEEVCTAGC